LGERKVVKFGNLFSLVLWLLSIHPC